MLVNLIIFDLDGTLIDSTQGLYDTLNELLTKNNFDRITLEEFKGILGTPLQNVFAELLDKNPADCFEYVKQFRKIYPQYATCELKDGAQELLRFLKEKKKNITLATVKSERMTTKILNDTRIIQYFDFITTSPNSEQDYSKDFLINTVLNKYEINKEEIVMIGDTIHDIIGAKSNGIKGIGIVNDFCTRKEFEEVNADIIVDSLKELENILK